MPSQSSTCCRSKYSAIQSDNLEKMGKAYLAVFSILQEMASASSDYRAGIYLPAYFLSFFFGLTSLSPFIRISLGVSAPDSCGGRTRMIGRWKLSVPHAALVVILPEGKCSPMLCPPHALLRRAIPECWECGSCYFRTRRCQSVCQEAHARTYCAHRTRFLCALSYDNKIVWRYGAQPHG